MKVTKAKWKVRRYEIPISYIFLVSFESFGGIRLVFSLVWSSKVKKAKKAASEAQTWNSKESKLFCVNLAFSHYLK